MPTNNTQAQAVVALVQRWRNEAAVKDSFHATMGIGWKVCANELEAALAALPAPQPVRLDPPEEHLDADVPRGDTPITEEIESLQRIAAFAAESSAEAPQASAPDEPTSEQLKIVVNMFGGYPRGSVYDWSSRAATALLTRQPATAVPQPSEALEQIAEDCTVTIDDHMVRFGGIGLRQLMGYILAALQRAREVSR